jgi:hypothetical protein
MCTHTQFSQNIHENLPKQGKLTKEGSFSSSPPFDLQTWESLKSVIWTTDIKTKSQQQKYFIADPKFSFTTFRPKLSKRLAKFIPKVKIIQCVRANKNLFVD